MAEVYVLVHAPLVGASTWRWVAEELADATTLVPDLHAASLGPAFDQYVDVIAAAIPTDAEVTLVGHSGSGLLLPFAAAKAKPATVTYVFVDAGLPPLKGSTLDEHPAMQAAGIEWSGRPSFAHLAEDDGHLPPWHTWWGDDGMAWLVRDAERRAAITQDIPRLPLAFWEQGGVVPSNWASSPVGYVLLSDNYDLWADAARAYGWPVEEVRGTHLELVNRPAEVAAAITRAATSARRVG